MDFGISKPERAVVVVAVVPGVIVVPVQVDEEQPLAMQSLVFATFLLSFLFFAMSFVHLVMTFLCKGTPLTNPVKRVLYKAGARRGSCSRRPRRDRSSSPGERRTARPQ